MEKDENTFTVMAERVDYDLSPREVIYAPNRTVAADFNVIETMPRRRTGIVENVEVVFFLVCDRSAEQVSREYESRMLVPDPWALTAVNMQDPELARRFRNGVQWNQKGVIASFLAFCSAYGNHIVDGNADDKGWPGVWYLTGVEADAE